MVKWRFTPIPACTHTHAQLVCDAETCSWFIDQQKIDNSSDNAVIAEMLQIPKQVCN